MHLKRFRSVLFFLAAGTVDDIGKSVILFIFNKTSFQIIQSVRRHFLMPR